MRHRRAIGQNDQALRRVIQDERHMVTGLGDLRGVGNGSRNKAGQCGDRQRQYQTTNGWSQGEGAR